MTIIRNHKSNNTNWLEIPRSTFNIYMYYITIYIVLSCILSISWQDDATDISRFASAADWLYRQVCSEVESVQHNTLLQSLSRYIRSSSDNGLSMEFMTGWPYRVAVSSPSYVRTYVCTNGYLSLFGSYTTYKRANLLSLEVADHSDMLDDNVLSKKSGSQVTLPLLQPSTHKYAKLT